MIFAPLVLLVAAQSVPIHFGPPLPPGEAPVRFEQFLDRSVVGTEDVCVLTLRIIDLPEADIAPGVKVQIKLPKGVEVLARSDEMKVQVELGTWAKTVKLTLGAAKAGRLRIPAATLKTRSTTRTGAPADLEVVAGHAEGADRLRPPLVLTAELDRQNVTVGQTAVLTFTLYAQHPIASVSPIAFAAPAGAQVEERQVPSKLTDAEVTSRSGNRFHSYVLRQIAITPTTPGTIVLAPVSVEVVPDGWIRPPPLLATSGGLALTVEP